MPQQPPLAMPKPIYSVDAPDQRRLKLARLEVELILKKYDLAAAVVLHTPGMSEFFYSITPSYSVCSIDEQKSALRIRSNLERDHGGDLRRQQHDQRGTANMVAGLADALTQAASMFTRMQTAVDRALRAEHTGAQHMPDPQERRPS